MTKSDLFDQHFEAATVIAAEGARVGVVTCKTCGACVLLDPRDSVNWARKHTEWHAAQVMEQRE